MPPSAPPFSTFSTLVLVPAPQAGLRMGVGVFAPLFLMEQEGNVELNMLGTSQENTTKRMARNNTRAHNAARATPRRARCLAAALTLCAAGALTTRAEIIAHWNFDETAGNTAHDNAGPFDGTLSPRGAAFVSGGISGNAISLSEANDGFINMGNVLGLTQDCATQLAECQAELAAARARIQELEAEKAIIDAQLRWLTSNFQQMFNDPQFKIFGETTAQQIRTLAGGILNLNLAEKQALYLSLGGQPAPD